MAISLILLCTKLGISCGDITLITLYKTLNIVWRYHSYYFVQNSEYRVVILLLLLCTKLEIPCGDITLYYLCTKLAISRDDQHHIYSLCTKLAASSIITLQAGSSLCTCVAECRHEHRLPLAPCPLNLTPEAVYTQTQIAWREEREATEEPTCRISEKPCFDWASKHFVCTCCGRG